MLEPAEIVREVEGDIEQVMRERLMPDVEGGGFTLAEPTPFARELAVRDEESRVAAVAWEWKGLDQGIFGPNFAPTGEEVTVRGVTLVTDGPEGPLFHRYIDWLDVFSQVGVTVSPRPIVDVRKAWNEEELAELDGILGGRQA